MICSTNSDDELHGKFRNVDAVLGFNIHVFPKHVSIVIQKMKNTEPMNNMRKI